MNILTLIGGNWLSAPGTQRFPDRQPPSAGYRGHVTNDPAACVACGICAQVCVSAAIEVLPADGSCAWTYDPARCAFCGICVLHCPVDALRQVPDRGDSTRLPDEQKQTTIIEYPPCPECGKPTMPSGENLLGAADTEHAEQLRRRARLCERCRRQATARVMKKTFAAMSGTERG